MAIIPSALRPGDTIGIISSCDLMTPGYLADALPEIEKAGFRIKLGKNIYCNTHGFAASPEERAEDLNAMFCDPTVRMVLIPGGWVANEILPLIDFAAVKQNPKILCGYSDVTTLLTAIYAKTGLVSFYGAPLRTWDKYTPKNRDVFQKTLMQGTTRYIPSEPWEVICEGACQGTLLGGYLGNFALMLNGQYVPKNPLAKYILFIEDHITFSRPATVSSYFAHIEQSGLLGQTTGLIWGNYSDEEYPEIGQILRRLADKHQIPLVCTQDFGHFTLNNSLVPLGMDAKLNTKEQTLTFEMETVQK